jgi:LysM repeat protein
MSDLPTRSDDANEPVTLRCPFCDSVVGVGDSHCLMCGEILPRSKPTAVPPEPSDQPPAQAEPPAETAVVEPAPVSAVAAVPVEPKPMVESVVRERQSPATFWLTAVFTVIIIILSVLVLRYQSPNVSVALVPSPTPIPPTATYTPTITPLPTETSPPTETPTITPIPVPTDTPRPPRYHVVAGGETLIGISLRFRIAPEAIAEANGFNPEQPIQVSQELVIPWPTATPPLESAIIEINNQPAVADVTDCEIYTIQPNDTAFGIAAARGIPLEAIRAVNRLTPEGLELLQPGDTLCLPEIVYTDSLPPTPGPSPTPSLTPLPSGPSLLYPINWAAVGPSDEVVRLVWTAVKDLTDDEWYMIELTDLTVVDSVPYRGFTRDTAFRLPLEWRPDGDEDHQFRWRVSIVQVMGEREDGRFIYTYGGQQSQPAYFTWQAGP